MLDWENVTLFPSADPGAANDSVRTAAVAAKARRGLMTLATPIQGNIGGTDS